MTDAPEIRLERAYDDPSSDGGPRFLVDRVWPRGVKREELDLEVWLREVAPSDELREWFDHDPERWEGFRERYAEELEEEPGSWRPLLEALREQGSITLVYGARDREHNNAVALRDFLESRFAEDDA